MGERHGKVLEVTNTLMFITHVIESCMLLIGNA